MGTSLPAPATLPPGHRIYAIGDTHGCAERLAALHKRITGHLAEFPAAHPLLVHLGDYVDRGPDSAGIVRLLLRGVPGLPAVNLAGNHERMMLSALDTATPTALDHWLHNGGVAALRSWDVPMPTPQDGRLAELIPTDHRRFLSELALTHRAGGYLFVHAGIRPGVKLAAQAVHDLLWIREPFLSWSGEWAGERGLVVVHGHTPVQSPVVRPNRIGIDTGAVLGGPLTCLVLEGNRMEFLFG
jgi:serine/threonine protein phosphatase 1